MSDSPSTKSNPLFVGGVPEHFNLPWHQAIEASKFSDSGIELKYKEIPGGTGAMMRGLRERELDIAIVLSEGGVASIARGNPSRIVKTYVESPLIWGIHVAANSDIKSVEGIEGSRYAISRLGSGSHLMAIVDASERGWDTSDIKFEKVRNLKGARKALAGNTADTFFWERFTTAPYVQSGEFRRVGQRRTLWPAFVICVHDEILKTRLKDVKTVLKVINDQCDSLMKDEHACQIIAARYQLRLADVEEWFAQTSWSLDFEKPTSALEKIKSYLLKLDLVTEKQLGDNEVWRRLD